MVDINSGPVGISVFQCRPTDLSKTMSSAAMNYSEKQLSVFATGS